MRTIFGFFGFEHVARYKHLIYSLPRLSRVGCGQAGNYSQTTEMQRCEGKMIGSFPLLVSKTISSKANANVYDKSGVGPRSGWIMLEEHSILGRLEMESNANHLGLVSFCQSIHADVACSYLIHGQMRGPRWLRWLRCLMESWWILRTPS